MNSFYPQVAARAKHRCEYCLAPEAIFNSPFEVEHIDPLCQGGLDDEINLALACRSCNLHKGTNLASVDPATGLMAALFHPRRDNWDGHFGIQGAEIVGLSPVGRATVQLLQFNARRRVELRKLAQQAGEY